MAHNPELLARLEAKRLHREQRLQDLGYERPDEDQRRINLELNLMDFLTRSDLETCS